MAAPGPTIPGVAMPIPLPRTYQSHYTVPSNDPLGGQYAEVMEIFRTEGATAHTADQILQALLATPTSFPNGLLGMYEVPGQPGGLSLLLSGLRKNPVIPGIDSPWKDMVFGFVGDVIDDEIPTASLPSAALSLVNNGVYSYVPATLARVDELLAVDTTKPLIGPITLANEPTAKTIRTRQCMYVPPKYLPIVAGRRLTPRQLWSDLVGQIRANNYIANCSSLVNWVLLSLLATTEPTAALPNPTTAIMQPSPSLPLPDHELVRYRRSVLHAQLPGLSNPITTDTNTAATHQLTNFVGQLIEEQRQARVDERIRAEEKRAPTKPSTFWGEELCRTLCIICGVTTEAQLPELWLSFAAAGKSKDRSALENTLQSVARTIGLRSSAPLATPDLTKKLVHLRFAGDNIDDLTDGIQPFVLTIQDHGVIGFSTQQDTQRVRQQNEEYDLLATDNISTTLADARTIRTTSTAKLPVSYDHMQVMFQAYQVLLHAMFGPQHPVVQAYESFTRAYFDEMLYYQGRLKALDCNRAPARLMRYVQLRMINWFREVRSTGILPPAPDFRAALQCMDRSESAWIPELPAEYRIPAFPPTAPQGSILPAAPSLVTPPTDISVAGSTISRLPSVAGTGISNANKTQIVNSSKNPIFQPFLQQVSRTRLADTVKKIGTPPTVQRNNGPQHMCLSYHLRGSCWTNCRRALDHQAHTADEDALLLEWCNTAYPSTS